MQNKPRFTSYLGPMYFRYPPFRNFGNLTGLHRSLGSMKLDRELKYG